MKIFRYDIGIYARDVLNTIKRRKIETLEDLRDNGGMHYPVNPSLGHHVLFGFKLGSEDYTNYNAYFGIFDEENGLATIPLEVTFFPGMGQSQIFFRSVAKHDLYETLFREIDKDRNAIHYRALNSVDVGNVCDKLHNLSAWGLMDPMIKV
jgi:hypothetical protein